MKGKEKEQRYLKRDYDHYHFTVKEFMKYTGQAAALCCGRLSFLQKCLGTASYDSGVSILSEMAAEPYDQGKKKEAELPV